jgi:hypothetical protein
MDKENPFFSATYISLFTFMGVNLMFMPLMILFEPPLSITIVLNLVIGFFALFVGHRVGDAYLAAQLGIGPDFPLDKNLTDKQKKRIFLHYVFLDNLKIPVLIGIIGYASYLVFGTQ